MKALVIISILLSSVVNSCEQDLSEFYNYTVPEFLDDGLDTGSLESAGINTRLISKAAGRIQKGKYGEVHSMLIYKDNKLVFEKYFEGHQFKWDAPGYYGEWVQWDRTMPHQIMSCTKSFVSACMSIAIDKGYIKSIHQSVFDFLPNHQQYRKEGRENISIEHLLTMTSGLQWDEWHAAHATAVFVVNFKFASLSHNANKLASLVPMMIIAGFPGFIQKLYAINKENGYWQGIYEWKSKEHLDAYKHSFVFRMMNKRAKKGTVKCSETNTTNLSEWLGKNFQAKKTLK